MKPSWLYNPNLKDQAQKNMNSGHSVANIIAATKSYAMKVCWLVPAKQKERRWVCVEAIRERPAHPPFSRFIRESNKKDRVRQLGGCK